MKLFVLWHRSGDGSGAHVERAYVDEVRAKEDFALIGKTSTSGEWMLDEVDLIGELTPKRAPRSEAPNLALLGDARSPPPPRK